jgi:hypothetical protein
MKSTLFALRLNELLDGAITGTAPRYTTYLSPFFEANCHVNNFLWSVKADNYIPQFNRIDNLFQPIHVLKTFNQILSRKNISLLKQNPPPQYIVSCVFIAEKLYTPNPN